MITRPVHFNAFEFVAVSTLRAQQLLKGCTPRLDGDHSAATMAQMEVAAGLVSSEKKGAQPAAVGDPSAVRRPAVEGVEEPEPIPG